MTTMIADTPCDNATTAAACNIDEREFESERGVDHENAADAVNPYSSAGVSYRPFPISLMLVGLLYDRFEVSEPSSTRTKRAPMNVLWENKHSIQRLH